MKHPRATLLLLALGIVASCRQLIGIEEATTDPSIGKSSSGQGSGGGQGGRGEAGQGDSGIDDVGGAAGQSTSESGGGGTGGEVAGQAGQGGAPGLEPEGSVCERYCDAALANCTGAFAIYTSREVCLAMCQALPEGEPGDRDVNTAQCRLRAALVATDEIPHYCPIAGPGGNDGCGSNCQGLCALREQICSAYVATDYDACLAECSGLTDLGSYSVDLSANQYAGPHVQCRLYHVSAAAVDDAEQHCLHVDGAVPCQ